MLTTMPHIDTINEPEATGDLADLYARYTGKKTGVVSNVLKAHSLNPASMEAHLALYMQAMHAGSPLSKAEREMIAVAVSHVNQCHYCLTHHASGLKALLPEERRSLVGPLCEGDDSALTDRERALTAFARSLAQTPPSHSPAPIEAMRAAGLTDREILDAAQVACYFCYVNRMVVGLGVELEDYWGEQK